MKTDTTTSHQSPADKQQLLSRSLRVVEQVVTELEKRSRGKLTADELRSLMLAQVGSIMAHFNSRFRFESYAAQRMRWTVLSELRKRRRRRRLLATRELSAMFPHAEDDGIELSCPRDTPEHALMLKQRRARIGRAVDGLSRRHARVVRRHFLEQADCSDLASELGISRSTVYRLRKEAMSQLAEQLAERRAEY
jgi:RNA polymerase sigma factor (sigma-70 family)